MSLVKNENLERNKNQIEVFVDAKTFDSACDRAYRKKVKKISVPGFRAGKAPRKVIEKRYGAEIFFDDAIEMVYPKALEDAIEEAGLDVVSIESLETIEAGTQKGLTFKAVCILKPEVKISNYKGIEIEKSLRFVDEGAVDSRLEALRERCARMVSVEGRAAKEGDTVSLDFEGFVDGAAFEGGQAKDHSLKLGSGQFIPGFEDQVIGHSVGDQFEVNVTFPEDYHSEKLKAKPAVFKCKLNEIREAQLPEEDDEFAKDVSEYDTLAELREDLKNKIKEEYEKAAEMSVESEITSALVKNMEAYIPGVMFERRIDELVRDFEQKISMQGITPEMYFEYMGTSEQKVREKFKNQAREQVKVRLALEEIAKLENIQVSDEDIEKEFKKLAGEYNMPVEKIRDVLPEDSLKSDILVRKAMNFVKDNAKIKEKVVEN